MLPSRLRYLVEDTRLNLGQRRGLARWSGKDGCVPDLIRSLNKPDGQLRTEGHYGSAPSLTCRRIAKVKGFKVLSRCKDKTLRSLIIDVQTAPAKFD